MLQCSALERHSLEKARRAESEIAVPLAAELIQSETGTKIISTQDSPPPVSDPPNQEASSGDDSSYFHVFNEVQGFLRTSTPQSSPDRMNEIQKLQQPSPAIAIPTPPVISTTNTASETKPANPMVSYPIRSEEPDSSHRSY